MSEWAVKRMHRPDGTRTYRAMLFAETSELAGLTIRTYAENEADALRDAERYATRDARKSSGGRKGNYRVVQVASVFVVQKVE